MRTKTLILTAALSAAGIVASMAQVYSVNVVGYVNVEASPGFSMIANQLDNGNGNRVADLLPGGLPSGSILYKFNGTGFESSTFVSIGGTSAWTDPDMTLNPGEGAYFQNAAAEATELTFVGEVMQGTLSNPIPTGFSIRSSMVPQAGDADTLGLTDALNSGDVVFQFAAGGFSSSTLVSIGGVTAWQPTQPAFEVGESFFIQAGADTSWDRDFTVE